MSFHRCHRWRDHVSATHRWCALDEGAPFRRCCWPLSGQRRGLAFQMDPTSFRMRYLLGILLAALLTAAALRHVIHVYAGFSREEIRTMALLAAGVGIVVVIIFFRIWKRQ